MLGVNIKFNNKQTIYDYQLFYVVTGYNNTRTCDSTISNQR